MKDKVLCPWCGGLMTLNVNAYSDGTVTGAWYECLVCKAESPYIEDDAADDIKAAALSAALQRYVEPANGCCWCIADGVINKVYIRTDDSDYTFVDAKFCPKCGRDLEDTE